MAETMIDVAQYAPDRIFTRGLIKALFGALWLGLALWIGFIIIFEVGLDGGDAAPLLLAPAIMLLFALHLPGGVGRMVSARAEGCYLRAGASGIEVRMPRQGWFGRFRVLRWYLAWEEVDRIVEFVFRINGIPTSRQLQIRMKDGTRLGIDRYYFAEDVATIQQRLLTIQAQLPALRAAAATAR